MQNKILDVYKEIRQNISVITTDSNSITGNFTCTTNNVRLIKQGLEFQVVSDVLENNRTVRDEHIEGGKTYQITLKSKITVDAEYYLSETDTDFALHFSKQCVVPKNLYIYSIDKEDQKALKVFEDNLLYVNQVYTLLEAIFNYKNEELDHTEFFLFSTHPLTIKTLYSRSKVNYIDEAQKLISTVNADLKNEIYKPLLRIEIINFLRLTPEKDRFKILLENLNIIYQNFTSSLTIYISQFSFDNFKDIFQKEKEKYFSSIREIVNKSYSQIIAIPISVGAVVFATNKLTENDGLIIKLIYGSFLLYVIYYLIIQVVYLADLIGLQKEYKEDFKLIKSKSGLSEDVLQKKSKQIRNKFCSSIIISIFLMAMVAALGILVCKYIYDKIYALK